MSEDKLLDNKQKIDKIILSIFDMFEKENLSYSDGLTLCVLALDQCIKQAHKVYAGKSGSKIAYERVLKALRHLQEDVE